MRTVVLLAALALTLPAFGQVAEADECNRLRPGCMEVEIESFTSDGVSMGLESGISLLGTCDDLHDCGKKAKKWCKKGNHGPPIHIEISQNNDKCYYRCADGRKFEIKCADKGDVAIYSSSSVEQLDECDDIERGYDVSQLSENCVEAEVDILLPGSSEDLTVDLYDVTAWGVISDREFLTAVTGYEGGTYATVVPLGSCDNVVKCAKKANKTCRNIGHGKAKKAYLAADKKSCHYECTGGAQGTIACADKPADRPGIVLTP